MKDVFIIYVIKSNKPIRTLYIQLEINIGPNPNQIALRRELKFNIELLSYK